MRMRLLAAAAALAGLSGCATTDMAPEAAAPVEVKLIAFNDFHGNLQPPRRNIKAPSPAGEVQVPAGGVAYLAAAIDALRAENPNHLVVSAGDMIGASPIVSNLFLDEPTIAAMNLIDIDFNAVGNHEFDRGRAELLRIKNGGCEKHTVREPCAVEPHKGADFDFLAANTLTEDGTPLFPAYGIRSFGSGAGEVKVGVIGMTLEGT
ncbi:MAG: metallophosphoesterase, partial [Allosphingosinicella sp.]